MCNNGLGVFPPLGTLDLTYSNLHYLIAEVIILLSVSDLLLVIINHNTWMCQINNIQMQNLWSMMEDV